MATTCDKEAIREAYNTVREDKSEINWAVLKYEGNVITVASTGTDYQSFLDNLQGKISQINKKKLYKAIICLKIDDQRLFAFLRIFTGDEMSKRAKFAFVSWIGSDVSALKRAKVSIEKGLVKEIITVSYNFVQYFKRSFNQLLFYSFQNFAIEVATSDLNDLAEEKVKEQIVKAGGANYGTGGQKN